LLRDGQIIVTNCFSLNNPLLLLARNDNLKLTIRDRLLRICLGVLFIRSAKRDLMHILFLLLLNLKCEHLRRISLRL